MDGERKGTGLPVHDGDWGVGSVGGQLELETGGGRGWESKEAGAGAGDGAGSERLASRAHVSI